MSRFVDSVIAYRILRMLVTPFEKTEAYRLGIIDKDGRELKKMRNLNTVAERDAYTILHRMVFRLRRIIEKVPVANKQLVSYAAALSLVKEHFENNKEPIDLEQQFIARLNEDLTEEILLVEKLTNKRTMMPFKVFVEEAPANNAIATPGIDGFTPETLGVKKKRKKLPILTRREVKYV